MNGIGSARAPDHGMGGKARHGAAELRALVVDDNELDLYLMQRMMLDAGFEIGRAHV